MDFEEINKQVSAVLAAREAFLTKQEELGKAQKQKARADLAAQDILREQDKDRISCERLSKQLVAMREEVQKTASAILKAQVTHEEVKQVIADTQTTFELQRKGLVESTKKAEQILQEQLKAKELLEAKQNEIAVANKAFIILRDELAKLGISVNSSFNPSDVIVKTTVL